MLVLLVTSSVAKRRKKNRGAKLTRNRRQRGDNEPDPDDAQVTILCRELFVLFRPISSICAFANFWDFVGLNLEIFKIFSTPGNLHLV